MASAICPECPVALDDQVLGDQAVAMLASLFDGLKIECRRERGRAFVVMRGVFAALPECRGLCFRCALECAKSPGGAEHLVPVGIGAFGFLRWP